MPRYFLKVAYDGTAFHGSQVQGDIPTVQLALDRALSTILRRPVETYGASRTDEGVHALCNFYHVDTDAALDQRTFYQLNAILPRTLAVTDLLIANDPQLNARFDALTRTYRYRIYTQKDPFREGRALYYPYRIAESLLEETAAVIQRTTDFKSFAKRGGQSKTSICTITKSCWVRAGAEWQYIVVGNRFLRGMVRALVATQLQVARGHCTIQEFEAIIAAKDCTKAFFNVAGHGLYLEDIVYPDGALRKILPESAALKG